MDRIRDAAAAAGAGGKVAVPKKATAFKAALLAAQDAAPRPVAPSPLPAGTARVAGTPTAADAAFRQRIAAAESSATAAQPGYGARNAASGALGRYQLLPVALRDIGWQDAAGGWTALAARHEVATEADFLASPAAQEAAMDVYLRRAAQLLAQNGALDRAGGAVQGLAGDAIPVSEAGLLAAAHRRGAGSVARYLAHRTETPWAPLSAQDSRAFAAVERRLRDFADLPLPQVARLPGRGNAA
jgi:hypothetical protein